MGTVLLVADCNLFFRISYHSTYLCEGNFPCLFHSSYNVLMKSFSNRWYLICLDKSCDLFKS